MHIKSYKNNSRWTVALSKESSIIKLPEDNIGNYPHCLDIGRHFKKHIQKALPLKEEILIQTTLKLTMSVHPHISYKMHHATQITKKSLILRMFKKTHESIRKWTAITIVNGQEVQRRDSQLKMCWNFISHQENSN